MMAATETTMVSHSRSPMTSETGRLHSSAMPKRPCSTCLIQRRYWIQHGLVETVLLPERVRLLLRDGARPTPTSGRCRR